MRATVPKTLTLVLAIVLILLLAGGGLLWWRVQDNRPARDAQRQAAADLKSLQAQVRASSAEASRKDPMLADLDEQLKALDAGVVEQAAGTQPQATPDLTGLAASYDDSAARLLKLSRSEHVDAQGAASLTSMAVAHWLTARQLTGRLVQVGQPGSAESRALAELTGVPAVGPLTEDGTCPAGDRDAKAPAARLAAGWEEAVWSEQVLRARAGITGASERAVERADAAQTGHEAQLTQLRESFGSDCGTLPAPRAGYRVAESEPGAFVTAQSRELAGIGYAMLREQLEADADRDAAWTRFAVRTLAVETALQASADLDIPALPGTAG
ncbi:hypothetical protein DEU33_1100 [Kocuria sp. AG109]|uniref:DUF4439 domain-containing protein n=1 Tax=Rothia kristinae TaxID=37923 RepID=A0A199NVA6_9MICC|nr:hypothetical protein [Rothia kristinae]MBG7588085.1 hypothetical protein [Rothia kristinae]MED6046301.1 hypothetical protein [Rothia kristinae]OAX52984.1 hypothetical protein AN277_0201125 [Rothia kristinae]TDP56215.1 hypothetical protein DEU33_1100 [Kocuria sp. AG109]